MTGIFLLQKNSCTSHDHRIGEYCFCEAIKVDLAESEVKCRKFFQALCCYFAYYLRIWDVLLHCMQNFWMRLPSYILWTQEIISSMDKDKEMIVTNFLLGKELSMQPVMMTRNIYSFMNHGVCLHTESSIEICLQFLMNSA